MDSAPPQPQDSPPSHPWLPREDNQVQISQAKNPKEAKFIISAYGNHL